MPEMFSSYADTAYQLAKSGKLTNRPPTSPRRS